MKKLGHLMECCSPSRLKIGLSRDIQDFTSLVSTHSETLCLFANDVKRVFYLKMLEEVLRK